MVVRPSQDCKLNHKFNIDDTSDTLLKGEFAIFCRSTSGVCAFFHAFLPLQCAEIAHSDAVQECFFAPTQRLTKISYRRQQPAPAPAPDVPMSKRHLALILFEGGERRHYHSGVSRWSQAHINFIGGAGGGNRRQGMDNSLTEAYKKCAVVDNTRSRSRLFRHAFF